MANEADTGKVITVETPFPEDISWVYKNQTFSDIILHCSREKVHAHKVILATRCPFFRSVLVEDPKMSEFTIDDVSVEAFRKIIQYIYTGTLALMSLDTALIFEVMKLACKFSLKNLELKISEEISSIIDTENVLEMFNQATMYKMEGLKNKCYTFIDECPFEILENDSIQSLSQKSMVSLLERDSLFVHEIEIFKCVQKWCEVNKDIDNLVVNCVRLNLLTNDEILKIVFPSKLIENQKLLEILARSVDEKSELSNSRCPMIEDENFANTAHGAQVISGENTTWLLSDNRWEFQDKCAFHSFDDKNGITVKLKNPFWTNHIQMKILHKKGESKEILQRCVLCFRFFPYYIEASQDQKTWQRVIDYSRYDCCLKQHLYFDKILAQYFRVVGIRNPRKSSNRFELFSFKLYWKSNTPKVKNGIVCPKENIISSSTLFTEVYGFSFYHLPSSCEFYFPNNVSINLNQPYWISNIKIRRNNNCGYNIETSLDEVNWDTVGNCCHECPSWQKFVFQERCVLYVKITLHLSPSSKYVEFLLTDICYLLTTQSLLIKGNIFMVFSILFPIIQV